MESTVTANAMSLSLLARNVYGVCFTMRDSRELLRGELAQAREKFFTGGRRALRVGKNEGPGGVLPAAGRLPAGDPGFSRRHCKPHVL